MEYRTLTPQDPGYPRRWVERLGKEAPPRLYYHGPLAHLSRTTMAVISADMISGVAMWAANDVLFTIREYALNLVGAWHSPMESEIFRLGLYFPHMAMTLFSAKGLAKETWESYIGVRYYPPFDKIPERPEYFRRAQAGELLMLSVAPPETSRMSIERNIVERNWLSCVLADFVFVPSAEPGSKTLRVVRRVLKAGLPIFTTGHEHNRNLHALGVPALTRKTVKDLLEVHGAVRVAQIDARGIVKPLQPDPQGAVVREPSPTYSIPSSDVAKPEPELPL